jgi:hypothetical protein
MGVCVTQDDEPINVFFDLPGSVLDYASIWLHSFLDEAIGRRVDLAQFKQRLSFYDLINLQELLRFLVNLFDLNELLLCVDSNEWKRVLEIARSSQGNQSCAHFGFVDVLELNLDKLQVWT